MGGDVKSERVSQKNLKLINAGYIRKPKPTKIVSTLLATSLQKGVGNQSRTFVLESLNDKDKKCNK